MPNPFSEAPFQFRRGSLPILVSFPHVGTFIPEQIAETMTAVGKSVCDTDWFVDRLYDVPELKQASWLVGNYSRFVIDLNRPSDNQSLYPGQATTGLFPETNFDGNPVYLNGLPNHEELADRLEHLWHPYHQQLRLELERLQKLFPHVMLIDAHSIRSRVPRLFDGVLPDFNLGTNYGQSCVDSLIQKLLPVLKRHPYSHVVNGRFIGGYITRHYAEPEKGISALQIELSQAAYMDELNQSWDASKAERVQVVFREIFQTFAQF